MVRGQSRDDFRLEQEGMAQAKSRVIEDKIFDFPNLPYFLDQDVKLYTGFHFAIFRQETTH
jgi:hypothetical protein